MQLPGQRLAHPELPLASAPMRGRNSSVHHRGSISTLILIIHKSIGGVLWRKRVFVDFCENVSICLLERGRVWILSINYRLEGTDSDEDNSVERCSLHVLPSKEMPPFKHLSQNRQCLYTWLEKCKHRCLVKTKYL